MKKAALIQLLLFVGLTSLHSQKKFWEVAGRLPILEQGVSKNTVLQGFNWVEVQDSFFVTITDFTTNSKNVMLGWVGEDLNKGLYKSINGGKSWEKVVPKVPLLPDPSVLQRLRQSMFAETEEQLYLNRLRRSREIITSLFSFGENFYMVNGGQQNSILFRSKDLGKTWEEMSSLEMSSRIEVKNNKLIKIENLADIGNSTFMGDNALIFSESQDSGRTWIKTFEGRSSVRYIRTGQDLSIDSKYLTVFYKYINEDTWYSEGMFENRKKQSEELHMADIRIIFRGTEKGTLFSIVRPETRFLPNSLGMPVGEEHFCQSTDGGNTWNIMSKVKSGYGGLYDNISRGIHHVDCNDVIYASLTSPVEGFCRSSNGGKTWEQLSGLPANPITGSILFAPDGYLYYVYKNQLLKSNEKICTAPFSSESNDNYEIVFYAYGPTNPIPKSNLDKTLENSPTGHIYVGFVNNNEIEKVKGLSPTGINFDWGKVDEDTDERYLLGYHTHCFSVKVTKKQYIDALKLSKSYYFSPINDCVSYADDIADLLGLNTPNITDAILLPSTYISFLKDNNKTISIESQWCHVKPKP